jgi:hypothetical protein
MEVTATMEDFEESEPEEFEVQEGLTLQDCQHFDDLQPKLRTFIAKLQRINASLAS